jgi:hypothetical protein
MPISDSLILMGIMDYPMISDITIIYYTANLISDFFANNVRTHLRETVNGIPIVSVSHRPIDFGENICMSDLKPSIYNIYKQILEGAKKVTTKYVACCEDDTLYVPEHFQFVPPESDTFYYNGNRWNLKRDMFFFRQRRHPTSGGMCMCVASTEIMIKTLEARFAKYPEQPVSQIGFGEPGRYDHTIGLERPKSARFDTPTPTLTFVHRPSQGGVRRVFYKVDTIEPEIPYWGNAWELWLKFHGREND